MGQKILVVEDNELNLKLFCDLLRAHGYEAEPVRDGREAVGRARAFAPDLIVMDIQMPHITGLELIEQIKADDELKPIPIMAVTAYAARGDEERIRDAGAEGYVSKPISVVRFVEAVRALLEAAAARGEAEAPGEKDTEAPETKEAPAPEGEAEESRSEAEEGGVPPENHPGEGQGEAEGGDVPPENHPGEGQGEAEGGDVPPECHPGESRDPDDSDDEEKLDPGSSPG